MGIKYIKYGIGSRIGDTIYLNKNLIKYPAIHAIIIEHERNHSSGLNKKDIMMDLTLKEIKGYKKEYYKFILTHPSTWTEYLPFWVIDGNLIINPILLGFYLVVLAMGGLISWFI